MKRKFQEISTPKSYNNHYMNQKFQKLVISKMSDVQFVFELDDEVVKIPAHKIILSASSPVFDAMFNGDIKEKGDVKIVDAPPDAFKEFLQFFYEDQVKLTMDNIGYVMNLVNKYDVAVCWPNCIEFLKENLTMDEVLWALNLALKFQLDDLKVFCKSPIEKNIEKVMGMFDLSDSPEVSLFSNPIKRFIPEQDVKNVFVCVFETSKKVISSQWAEIKRWREQSITLSKDEIDRNLCRCNNEVIYFKLNTSMLLTRICGSKIYTCGYGETSTKFQLIIKEKQSNPSEVIFEKDFSVGPNSCLELENPMNVKAECIYAIILNTTDNFPEYTDIATIPDEPVELSKNITISFPRVDGKPYTHSLIRSLHFKEICEDEIYQV